MTDFSPVRQLALEGAFNVRDLGGYPARDGQTRWSAILRADGLHRLTEQDQQRLLDYGVRTIIDLRHAAELQESPNVFCESTVATYHNVPIFRNPTQANNPPVDLAVIYRMIVDECHDGLREALSAIADAAPGGVLVHCTAGKDRTGIVSALLLGIAGVADDVIAADYALTTDAIASLRPLLQAGMEKAGMATEVAANILSSNAEQMADLLAYLHAHYGTLTDYVRAVGLSDDQIARIRARFVEPTGA